VWVPVDTARLADDEQSICALAEGMKNHAVSWRLTVALLIATLSTDGAHALPARKSPPRFDDCFRGGGINCVVDGDTFWMDGQKIRIADIDAPETHQPRCVAEKELGDAATERLRALLNAGPFVLASADRDTDHYGRKLRIVMRRGASIGEELVAEGLAREWDGARHPWCV
jgi:micrococcal nuclease